MAAARTYLLVSLFVFAFIFSSSISDDIPTNPYPYCYAKCWRSYGEEECKIDCIKKKFVDGKCLKKDAHHREPRTCCCN
ncbi:hypothetical protein COLO4_06065 [Corchorus olitorius]|uniref:Defensin-like domain-containing protein n=1 Tax=Corchorus olitorius TaxID=93759 RepID=A0A1R3KPB7_9ROSI|nr:hypothetical protein COLO4_06065 [Corchorus olitorius]